MLKSQLLKSAGKNSTSVAKQVFSAKSKKQTAQLMQGLNSQRNLSSSFVTKSTPSDSFAWVGSNSQYLEELELQWRANPSSVPVEWQTYFASLPEVGSSSATFQSESSGSSSLSSQAGAQGEIISLIRAFQVFGHHVSKLDPLGKYSADLDFQDIPQLVCILLFNLIINLNN